MTLWSHGLVRSCDNLKSLFFYYHNIYDHKVWQAGDLPSDVSTHYVTPPFLMWQTKNIFTCAMPMVTKLGKMMNYLEWPLAIKSHDCIIRWSCKITWQTKIITYPLTQWLWLSVLLQWEHAMRSSFPQSHQILWSLVLQSHVKYISCCITTTTRSILTELGKVVTNYKKLQPLKSHNSLNMWSREVTWWIKNILSPLSQCL